jgi:hypothetical protein
MNRLLRILSNIFMGAFFWDPLYYVYIPAGLLGIGLKLYGARYQYPALFAVGNALYWIFLIWIAGFVGITAFFFLKWFVPMFFKRPPGNGKNPSP